MTTNIYTTKKLEKIISSRITTEDIQPDSLLGKWNASVLYIAKKKCLIFVNSKSFFTVVIPRFSTKDLKNIDQLFFENFIAQLYYEKIEIDPMLLKSYVEKLNFRSTDNDRKINGVINYNISKIDDIKYDYTLFNSGVIREITQTLNITPFKQLGWKYPVEVMAKILAEIVAKDK